MKLSTKGTYSTRMMLDLALHFNESPILIKDISERQRIPKRYLEQLFIPLRASGLVRSIRGAHGGFSLTKPPAEIRLSEIIQVTEGSIAPVECVNNPNICGHSDLCATRDIWTELEKAMNGVLESTTLQDLVERQKRKEGHEEIMYNI